MCSCCTSQFPCFDLALYPLYLSSFPLFVKDTQTKASIITLTPSSEKALYSQLPCPACWPCTAGPDHLKHTSFLSVLMPSFPDCFQFVLEKILLIPFFQCSAKVPLSLFLISLSFPFYLLVEVQLPSPHYNTRILPCEWVRYISVNFRWVWYLHLS